MASLHPSELESGTTDSVASSPRSDHHDLHISRVRFMCSFGGKILPRPHDNQLRYVGGDTRIVAVHRSTTFSALLTKLSKLAGGSNISVKYQLPNEDLDALISVTTDEDVENMMEEYDRIAHNQNQRSARLRLFLFTKGDDSRASSISSLLDGAANREHWFFDALNSGAGLERGRSEASSIMSEVPDYLFGLDNSDETQPREPKMKSRLVLHENVSMSDPGSPAPVVSSPFCSTSSAPIVPSMPDLPPVKTKPDNPVATIESKRSGQVDGYVETVETQTQPIQPNEYSGQPMWQYFSDSHYSGPAVQQIPVYYVPGPVQPGNASVQPVSVQAQYVHQYPVPGGQMPVGYHQPVPSSGQIYGGAAVRPVVTMDHAYDPAMRVVPAEGVNQQVYYGVRNAGLVQGYPGMIMPGGEELTRTGSDVKAGRISQSS
ncbi:uncharacterized protein LOC116134782 [Pistacia vera]|uniref:uncharacterized protein LOC116112356 n=1 Tax=Pistacia vera TaxID=55513 RepID=UPI0012633545|nr:uncharacterized protein LOC116112356 [Pistacia vera]XP_031276288.1 uncharacterized protein LOC116134782 [Pistacia vera]